MSLAFPFTPSNAGAVVLATGSAATVATIGDGDVVRVLNESTQTISVQLGTTVAATNGYRLLGLGLAGNECFIRKAPGTVSIAAINLSAITAAGSVSFTVGNSK